MAKAFLHQRPNNLVCPVQVVHTRCQPVTAGNDFGASDGAQSYSFDIAGFKTNRSTSRDIEPLPVGFSTVKGQCGIGFDEVVMRTNLIDWLSTT